MLCNIGTHMNTPAHKNKPAGSSNAAQAATGDATGIKEKPVVSTS